MGVAYSTLRTWRDKFSALSAALKRGKEIIDRQVENALLKRALGYTYEEVTKERMADTGQKKRHDGAQKLTEKDWVLITAYFNHSCCYCGGTGELTKDHLDPLKNHGTLEATNIVPACRPCNSSKQDKQWLTWYQTQKFYDRLKATKIQDYIIFAHTLITIKNEDDIGEMLITKVVTKEVQPDTTAQIFWLKNRKPEMWRDKQQAEQMRLNIEKTKAEIESIKGETTHNGGEDWTQALMKVAARKKAKDKKE